MNFKLNNVKIAGRISKDVSINLTSKSTKQVGNISIALDVSGDRTLFVNVTAWSEVADIIPKLQKGDLVYVDGRLDLDYKDEKKIIITAEKITLLHSKLYDKLGKTNEDLEQMFTIEEIKQLEELKK